MVVEYMSEMETTSKSNPDLAFVSAGSPHKFETSSRTSSSAFSRKSAAKSTAVSRPLKRSETASKEQSCAVGSTVPAPCSKMKTISRPAKVISKALVAPWVKAKSVATAQLAKLPHNQKNIKASAKMEHLKKSLEITDVALNLHEVNLPSASHLKSAIPELKKPRKEPSHVSASKTTLRGNTSKVGLNQLMVVSWEGRQQVYCLLCSARLKSSSHLSSYNHCLNYVKYLGWITAPSELESKLSNIVARLAEVERDVGFQSPQRLEVTKEVYKKLAALAEDKAIEMVKAVLMQKDPRVSSFKAQTAEALRWEAASPCQVSSSVDGVSVVDNISECYNQTQQEHKLEETLQIQSTGKDNVVELWSVKGQSSNEDQSDVVQEQLQASVCDKVQPDLVPETVQHDKFEPDTEVHYMSEIAHGNENSDTKDFKTPSDAEHSHTPVRQHWLSDSASQVTQKGLESPPEPVQICSPQLQTPASVATEQQNPSGSSLSTEQGTGFGQPSSSPAQSRTVFGAKLKGCSHLSIFLKVDQSVKSVIGMAFVWECRGLSQKTFYLCESCREMLTHRDICGHMVSLSHQLKHLWKTHPDFLQMFWLKEDLPLELKMDILSEVVCELAARECFYKVDAQCVLLGEELYWLVQTAFFSEALKVVKDINKEKQIAFCRPVSSAQQNGQQGDCLSAEKPHPTEALLAPVSNTKPTNDFESKHDVKKMSMEEDLHVVRKRASSPDVNASVKNDPCASPIPIVPSHRYPHKTSSGSSPQPTLSSNLSRLQRSDLPSQVQLLSASTSTISSTVSQNVEVSLTKKVP